MKNIYLLDTNIVSEFSKDIPNPKIIEVYKIRKDLCAISAVTWQELTRGVTRLPEGRKKQYLKNCLSQIEESFPILPYDKFASQICGEIQAKMESKGKTLPFSDSQIAATALSNGMVLVTHNTQHFKIIQENSFLQMEDWFE